MPKTAFADLANINFGMTNNGAIAQKGNTANMLWKIDELIAYASQYFTLRTGDVLFTGTPEGVAKVSEGDVLEGSIEGNKLFRIQVK
jgi:2-keto-4-pentenoate hydratase/2-oxohepta-3-ene-1,7-dioic acid hydratase in catechol pathway